jgi:hypothetical protein
LEAFMAVIIGVDPHKAAHTAVAISGGEEELGRKKVRAGRPGSRCSGPSVDDDPVGAWRTQADAVQALLDEPATAEREHELPHLGRMPLG